MSPPLRPGLHYLRITDSYIFFDLLADRYFLLTNRSAEAFERFANGSPTRVDEDHLHRLGLTGEAQKGALPRGVPTVTAARSLVDTPLAGAGIFVTIASVAAQRRARRDLGRHPLAQILSDISCAQHELPLAGDKACRDVAGAFQRAKRYVSGADQCLPRGIAMKRMMARQGQTVSLVFGVTMPFAAHSWVQAGNLVLTDPLDIVLHYQPIFAV
ncbi:MAG TPA: lasso peptide biosynthesis B2 protein [Sphingopyxis sp.]|uniref:lasso peptide biosynthesis B2 protein n=1 Tax=Sphingopyxis sp. TaxID=1908224 RepID=UPI002E345407|nr:lasso peptide biosynthesis B2 protein [Sphingopyxis sp.]HEX2813695.1 lasso peptide biosynthesis B2 protein [Sphingopyxis sp.]